MSIDLDLNQLKNNSISINYCWDSCTHLLKAGVGENQSLFILEHIEYPPKTLTSTLLNYVKGDNHKKYKVYTNLFDPFKRAIGARCKQFSEELVEEYDIFYENLRLEGKVFLPENMELPIKDKNFSLSLKFLLKGLLYPLTGGFKGGLALPKSSMLSQISNQLILE